MRCARLLTVTTREPGTGNICSSSSPVKAKGPRWLVPNCSSNPSRSGCAIATMVLELAPGDEDFSADFDRVFARWRAALVTHFVPLGVTPDRARALAGLT